MAVPTLRVELWNGAAWVNAGEIVKTGEVNREGYRPELDQTRPGTATFTVKNADRSWDPDYSAGAHAAYLDSGCPIRLVIHYGVTDYNLFTGIIDQLKQGYDSGDRWAIARVTAVDPMSLAAQRPLPSGLSEKVKVLAAGGPVHYLPLDEPPDQTLTINPLDLAAAYSGGWGGAAREPVVLSNTAAGGKRFQLATTVLVLPYPFLSEAGTGNWSLGFYLQVPSFASGTWYRNILQPNRVYDVASASGDIKLVLTNTGLLRISQCGNGGEAMNVIDAGVLNDGAPHHITFECAAGVGMTVYIDGQPTTSAASFGATRWKALSTFPHFIGGDSFDYFSSTYLVDTQSIAIGHIVQIPKLNVGPQLTLVGVTGTITFNVYWDLPGQRIQWALDKAGIVAGTINMGTKLLRGVVGGDLPIDHIRAVAASDGGFFWVDPNGQANYLSPPSGAVVATFADDGSGIGYKGLEPVRDASRKITAARAEIPGITFPATVARYDNGGVPTRELSFRTLNLQVTDAIERCQALVARLEHVGSQYPTLSFMPHRGNNWVAALTLDLGQLVRVKRTPQGIGTGIDRICTIEGIRHTFDEHMSRFTTTLSLGVPGPNGGFILDVSLLDVGVLF